MMWFGLLAAVAISAVALLYVVLPLLKPGPAPILVEDDRLAELLGRKDAVMKSIKDLEFDYQVGKLSEEDFQLYDQRLRRQAVTLIQQIEEAVPESAQLDDAVEAEISQRRKVADRPIAPALVAAATQPAPAQAQPAAPATVVVPVAAAAGSPVRYCTNCGNRLELNHKFCAICGTPVAA